MERQVKASRPFYLQLSHYGGGSEEEVTPETLKQVSVLLGSVRQKELCEAGVVADMDKTTGRIFNKVDQLGIAENTYIIYSADHGSPGRNLPLSGGKGSVLEGGLRVPFIIRGIKSGTVSHVHSIGWDLAPTLADLAGITGPLPKQIEGGGRGKDAREGIEAAGLYEWGGRNDDGTFVFREKRPGWSIPIHDLLGRKGVSVVFHGHDHLYAKQEPDGIVYQAIPQPGHPGNDVPRAEEYGYIDGTILGGSGHLRISVSPSKTTVDYMAANPPSETGENNSNRSVRGSYFVRRGPK